MQSKHTGHEKKQQSMTMRRKINQYKDTEMTHMVEF